LVVFALLAGIGMIFGLRLHAIALTAHEVQTLKKEQNRLWAEIDLLRAHIKEAGTPAVIERKAREILRWGYPDEEMVILIRKR
jgi:cell division protein FtsB